MKVALFRGDVSQPRTGDRDYLSMDQILTLATWDPRRPLMWVLLVPDDFDLRELRGDDWNDAPAEHNAGDVYESSLPPGARWVMFGVGDEWPVI